MSTPTLEEWKRKNSVLDNYTALCAQRMGGAARAAIACQSGEIVQYVGTNAQGYDGTVVFLRRTGNNGKPEVRILTLTLGADGGWGQPVSITAPAPELEEADNRKPRYDAWSAGPSMTRAARLERDIEKRRRQIAALQREIEVLEIELIKEYDK